MHGFWQSRRRGAAIDLTLPERLREAETMVFLGAGFDIARTLPVEGEALSAAARQAGYELALAQDMTPSVRLESFVHDHGDHRLILYTHVYKGFKRQVMHLILPGGIKPEAFEGFRAARGIDGKTYDREGQVYGDWTMPSRQASASANPAGTIFVELRQESIAGDAYMLRVMFHHVARA